MLDFNSEILKFCSFDEDKDYDEEFVRWWVDSHYPQYWDIDDVIEDIGSIGEALVYRYNNGEFLDERAKVERIYKAIDRAFSAVVKYYCV